MVPSKNYCTIPRDSDLLLYPSGNDTVWWDLKLSKELARKPIYAKHSGVIAVSPTEPLLASAAGGDFIFLWNWQTRRLVDRLRGSTGFYSVAFSPDGRRLIAGSHGQEALTLWDVPTRQEIAKFGTSVVPALRLHTVQFSPDGNMICAIDFDGNAYFLQAPSLKQINALEVEQQQAQRQ